MHTKITAIKISYEVPPPNIVGLMSQNVSHYLEIEKFKDLHVEPMEYIVQRASHLAAQAIRTGAKEIRIHVT